METDFHIIVVDFCGCDFKASLLHTYGNTSWLLNTRFLKWSHFREIYALNQAESPSSIESNLYKPWYAGQLQPWIINSPHCPCSRGSDSFGWLMSGDARQKPAVDKNCYSYSDGRVLYERYVGKTLRDRLSFINEISTPISDFADKMELLIHLHPGLLVSSFT